MKTKLLAAAAVIALSWGAAGVASADVTFMPYTSLSTDIPASDVLITQWGSFSGTSEPTGAALGSALTLPTDYGLTGGNVVSGTVDCCSAAPTMPGGTFDTAPYLSIAGGESATLMTPGIDELDLYAGSFDYYNSVTFTFADGSQTFTGTDLGLLPNVATNGDRTSPNNNGLFTFSFDKDFTSVTFGSNTNAFEIADLGTLPREGTDGSNSGIPEPTTWALMALGLFGVGAAMRTSRRQAAAAAA
jgi:hypothetical protein